MSEEHWKDLYEKLQILGNPKLVPVGPPTVDDIVKFQTGSGFLLPASFKDFILVFGPGILAKEFQIYSPHCKHTSFDLLTLNYERFGLKPSTSREVVSPFPKTARLQRLVAFCTTTLGNDRFAWDPNAITNSSPLEYAVFFHRRLAKQPKKVADTFGEFVDNLCLGNDFFKSYRRVGYWNEFFPRKAFAPALSGRYKKPNQSAQSSRTGRSASRRATNKDTKRTSPRKRKRKSS
jgi:hypothetical protein